MGINPYSPYIKYLLLFIFNLKYEVAEITRDRLLEVILEEGAPAPEIARRYREIYGYEPPTLHGFLGTLLYQKQIEEVRKGRSYFSKGTIYKRIHHEDA